MTNIVERIREETLDHARHVNQHWLIQMAMLRPYLDFWNAGAYHHPPGYPQQAICAPRAQPNKKNHYVVFTNINLTRNTVMSVQTLITNDYACCIGAKTAVKRIMVFDSVAKCYKKLLEQKKSENLARGIKQYYFRILRLSALLGGLRRAANKRHRPPSWSEIDTFRWMVCQFWTLNHMCIDEVNHLVVASTQGNALKRNSTFTIFVNLFEHFLLNCTNLVYEPQPAAHTSGGVRRVLHTRSECSSLIDSFVKALKTLQVDPQDIALYQHAVS